mgnify:CR=1 FL=1
MAAVTYVARRGLAPAHSAGTAYTFPLSISDLQRPQQSDLKYESKSISGQVETLYFGEERIWTVTLAPVRIADAAILYEFLRSTGDGQDFTFDPYGTTVTSVQPLTVKRSDNGFSESVFQRLGQGGLTDWVQFGFSVREVG